MSIGIVALGATLWDFITPKEKVILKKMSWAAAN